MIFSSYLVLSILYHVEVNYFIGRAGDGNRIHTARAEVLCSTIKLRPHMVIVRKTWTFISRGTSPHVFYRLNYYDIWFSLHELNMDKTIISCPFYHWIKGECFYKAHLNPVRFFCCMCLFFLFIYFVYILYQKFFKKSIYGLPEPVS